MTAVEEKNDFLALASNRSVQKVLLQIGKNTPSVEAVVFSDFVIKINKRGKEQTRVLLITNKAVYNLMPSSYGKCKRRIPLDKVVAISTSAVSEEFVLHVPTEYDYRFKSWKKDKIAQILEQYYKSYCEKELGRKDLPTFVVRKLNQERLDNEAKTKVQAKNQSQHDVQRRIDSLREAMKQVTKQQEQSAAGENGTVGGEDDEEGGENGDTTTPIEGFDKVGLDDFKPKQVIGKGSFGKVLLVEGKRDGKVYAMKILKKKHIIEKGQVEHTVSESKILKAARFPFLMNLRYAFQTKGKLYFVLDYFTGGELFFHLRQHRRFSEDAARIMVAEVAAALGHLHSHGIIYRDLKPENILLDPNGHVCVTDFGLSKFLGEGEKAFTFCGTPEYLAPEVITGVGHDKAVDWWSVGILLYELTVGIPPFYSQNHEEMYQKIQHGVLRFPPFLSENCRNIIIALLNRDPTKRMGSRDDIREISQHPFFAVLNWDKLIAKEIDPIFKPDCKDTVDENIKAVPLHSMATPMLDKDMLRTAMDAFEGFTFNENVHKNQILGEKAS